MKDSANAMKYGFIRQFAIAAGLALGVGLLGAPAAMAQTDSDPADVNMAPADASAQQPASPAGVVNESQQQADEYKRTGQLPSAPANAQQQGQPPQGQYQGQGYPQGDQGYSPYDQGYGQPGAPYGDQGQMMDQIDAGQEALETSTAPPALPEYAQPMAPGPNYIWTPGYWYWGSAGYFWTPGAWVLAPYPGALWTPGYWGFYGGRYRWN
ncbi:MAG: YXWGXW repeat-containing protein, partial [Acidobacteriaceae bacterium]|nr:YXWGXW repeat-containing protein [Acidobacteriaceae bacterium]